MNRAQEWKLRRSFLAKVESEKTPSGCRLWKAGVAQSGYGQMTVRIVSEAPLLSHRVAWMLYRGPIPKGMHILHTCDNRRCVNVDHLFLGTQTDNNEDRNKKGRTASGNNNGARTRPERNPFVKNRGSGLHGEKHPMAKLSWRQVRAIKKMKLCGATATEAAKRFSVSVTHACRIYNGQSWKRELQNA